VDLELSERGRGRLGDHYPRLEGAMAFRLWGGLPPKSPNERPTKAKDVDRDDERRRDTNQSCVLDKIDCLLHWSSAVHQRFRVTGLLLWSKSLGEECFEARLKASRSLKGKDDPFGRYAFTTWEGGRS
jgi:hypothetical protein